MASIYKVDDLMRGSFLHPIAERRRDPPRRRRLRLRAGRPLRRRFHTQLRPLPQEKPLKREVARVRAAGGPKDDATYTCSCGYLFSASVSTTVACPHCGAKQAW